MKTSEFKPQNNYTYEIPPDTEVMMRIVSPEHEHIARHWGGKGVGYVTCIGEKKGCQFCANGDKPISKYATYIKDANEEVKLALLPYSVISQINEIAQKTGLIKDDVPQLYVKVFRSGKGIDTVYLAEQDMEDKTNVDISNLPSLKEYVQEEKNKIKPVEASPEKTPEMGPSEEFLPF